MYDRSGTAEHEDARIAADFLAGKSRGLEGLYAAYGTLLFSVARKILENSEDAQDCVHDALLRLWQNSESYRPERGSLRNYLLVCVRNEALTRRRNAARRFRIEERATFAEGPAYEFEVSDHVERDRLRRALGSLPADQRAALELAYFGHLTHVQVAERLGEPLGTIKSRIALALRKLNAALAAPGAGAS